MVPPPCRDRPQAPQPRRDLVLGHRQKRSWEDEFHNLLRRHWVQYDERYLWD
jgi:hypothetical protein